jgi:hypothetical protein
MMRDDKFDLSRLPRETLSCERPSQRAVKGGKPQRGSPQATKATRPLTARCGRYDEESVAGQ